MTATFDHGYALLIAVDQNITPTRALPDIIHDVDALSRVLRHPQRCGYLDENIKVIHGKDSTRAGILAGLDWLWNKLKADTSGETTALIYYTGHGALVEGGHYLIPYDYNRQRLAATALRADDLAAEIAVIQPKRLLVALDCCRAGGMGVKDLSPDLDDLDAAAIPPSLIMKAPSPPADKGLEALMQGDGRAVLASCRAGQRSYLRRDRKMSLFTYHLIEALTGHAQPVAGATEVLVSDIMSHVTRQVPLSVQAHGYQEEQQPDFQVSGNFPVALLLGGNGLGKGEKAPDPLAFSTAPQAANDPGSAASLQIGGDAVIAQGPHAQAAGPGGVIINGDNSGNINTGVQITLN